MEVFFWPFEMTMSSRLDIETNTESVFAKVTLDKNKTLIIGSVYRPPSSDTQYMEDLCTTIECIGQRFKNAVSGLEMISILPTSTGTETPLMETRIPLAINNRFLDANQNCSLEQKITFLTRKESTLDLFLTNRPSLLQLILPGLNLSSNQSYTVLTV